MNSIDARHQQIRRKLRRGVAAMEFAVVAPIFFTFAFACIEFARVNMLRNTAEIAATEGARAGVIPGASANDCIARAQEELAILGATGQSVTVEPSTISTTTSTVRVRVSIPLTAANGYFLTPYFIGKSVGASIQLTREG